MFVLLFWGVVRIYAALDVYRFQGLMTLIPLLAVPLVRVGLAPSSPWGKVQPRVSRFATTVTYDRAGGDSESRLSYRADLKAESLGYRK